MATITMPCEKSWWNSRRMTSASATSVTWNSSKQSSAADCGARSKEGLGTTCGRRRRRRERRRRGLRQRRRRTRRGRSGGRRRGRRRRGRRRRRSQAVCTSIGGRGRHVGKRGVRRWQARVAHRGARLGDVVCESRHRVTRAGVRLRAVPQTGCAVWRRRRGKSSFRSCAACRCSCSRLWISSMNSWKWTRLASAAARS